MPGMKRDCGGAAGILGAFYTAVKLVCTIKQVSWRGEGVPWDFPLPAQVPKSGFKNSSLRKYAHRPIHD